MKRVACIGKIPGLTTGKYYDIKSTQFTSAGTPMIYLLINDDNEEKWYNIYTTNVSRQLAETTDVWLEYLGGLNKENLTIGKYYEALIYDNYSTCYILDDNGVFAGFLKNMNGRDNFIDVTDMVKRNDILDNLLDSF